MKNIKRLIISFNIFIFFLALLVYITDYYRSDNRVNTYLKSSDEVTVKKINQGYFFDGKGDKNAIIFYPGAKVEYTSYAPLMYKLASEGIDTFLVEMPYNIAFLSTNKANGIIKKYNYDNIYMSGHSMGGVVASNYTIKNSNKIKGLILLASYTTRKIPDNVSVLSIYGSNDRVLNIDKYNKYKSKWPNNSYEYIIDCGNHANFGSYGIQDSDGIPCITREEQENITVAEIKKYVFSKEE